MKRLLIIVTLVVALFNECCTQKYVYLSHNHGSHFNDTSERWSAPFSGPLSKSRNYVEIRVEIASVPNYHAQKFVLGYDSCTKTGLFKRADFAGFNDTAGKVGFSRQLSESEFFRLFESVKATGIFRVKSERQLKIRRQILDGVFYTVSYKTGSVFGDVTFSNPDWYANEYPRTKAFKVYCDFTKLILNYAAGK